MNRLTNGYVRLTGKCSIGVDVVVDFSGGRQRIKHKAAGKEVINWLVVPGKEFHVCREGIYWKERDCGKEQKLVGGILNRCRQRADFYPGCWAYGRDSKVRGRFVYFINEKDELCYFDSAELQPKPFIVISEVQAFAIGKSYLHTLSQKGRLQKWIFSSNETVTLKSTLVLRRMRFGEDVLMSINHKQLTSLKVYTTLAVRKKTKLVAALENYLETSETTLTFFSVSVQLDSFSEKSVTCSNPCINGMFKSLAVLKMTVVDERRAVALMTSDYAAVLKMESPGYLKDVTLIRLTEAPILLFSSLLFGPNKETLVYSGFSKPDTYHISAISITY